MNEYPHGTKVKETKMTTVELAFSRPEYAELFLGWLSDGGGEQDLYDVLKTQLGDRVSFDYSKAFRAWGYEPDVDGHPVVLVTRYEDWE